MLQREQNCRRWPRALKRRRLWFPTVFNWSTQDSIASAQCCLERCENDVPPKSRSKVSMKWAFSRFPNRICLEEGKVGVSVSRLAGAMPASCWPGAFWTNTCASKRPVARREQVHPAVCCPLSSRPQPAHSHRTWRSQAPALGEVCLTEMRAAPSSAAEQH